MISSMPLPRLVERIEDVPGGLAEAARSLRHASVLNLNRGFHSPCPLPYHTVIFDIPHAYVVHDRHRRVFLPDVVRSLERHGIWSVGRYGAWQYSAMEDALCEGAEGAKQVIG